MREDEVNGSGASPFLNGGAGAPANFSRQPYPSIKELQAKAESLDLDPEYSVCDFEQTYRLSVTY